MVEHDRSPSLYFERSADKSGFGDAHLARDIRKWDLLAFVLNSIIGAGIFGLPSRVYALAGSYSLLAFLVCAIPIFLIVLCFAEVGSRFKETGGLYLYARSAFGSFAGFEIGWLAWLARLTALAALCNLFADYLGYFVPAFGAGAWRFVVMSFVVGALTAVNIVGVRRAALFGNIFTIGKLVPLLIFVAAGMFFANFNGYSSSAAPSYSNFSSSVLLLVFAFTGFEIAGVPAGEVRNPQEHLPFALLAGTAISVLLYVAIQAVCIGTLPSLADSTRPLADAALQFLGKSGAAIIALGALISITGTMNAIMLAAPRLLFAMADYGQLPAPLSRIHRRFHTPHIAILISAGGMLALTLTGTFASAVTLSTIIRLITYAVTCAALPILRRRTLTARAPFRIPAGKFVSLAAIALVGWLLLSSSWFDVAQVLIAGMVGLVLYVACRNSKIWRVQ